MDRWFDNLLPDSDVIRARLSARHRVDARDAHALLGAIGRDCVGAIQLPPDGVDPGRVDEIAYRTLTAADVASRLLSVPGTRPFGSPVEFDDDLRISIAGAQEKTALLWHDERWCVPEGNTPTTHIVQATAWRHHGAQGKLQRLGGERVAVPHAASYDGPSSSRE